MLDELQATALPFEGDWDEATLASALDMFCGMLLSSMGLDSRTVWAGLLDSRYADAAIAPLADASRRFSVAAGTCCCDGAPRAQRAEMTSMFEPVVARVVRLIRKHPVDLQRQTTEWYLELLVYNLVGKENLRSFVSGCHLDKKIELQV